MNCLSAFADDEPFLAGLYSTSVRGRIAMGPRAGRQEERGIDTPENLRPYSYPTRFPIRHRQSRKRMIVIVNIDRATAAMVGLVTTGPLAQARLLAPQQEDS